MTISRRDILIGATIASTIATSSTLSACSPASLDHLTGPGQFFALLARGEWVRAREMLADDASLSVVSSVGGQTFTDRQGIVELLGSMLQHEGFNMIGDNADQSQGGMYWRLIGPWLCSDMLRGDAVDMGNCGDGLGSSVFNVFTDPVTVEDRIKTILLLENRNLVSQFANDPSDLTSDF